MDAVDVGWTRSDFRQRLHPRLLARPGWGARNNPDAEQQIGALLAAWRQAKWPIIHVQHMSQEPRSPLRADVPGNAFKPEAVPHDGEPVFQAVGASSGSLA